MSETATQLIPALVIEDDAAIRHMLSAALQGTEFHLHQSATGKAGLESVARKQPEVILLDLGLPDQDGVAIVRNLRTWSRVPIIIISAEGDELRKVEALEAGADDYVTKPFGVNELLARMRVVWRRAKESGSPQEQPIVRFGDVEFDQIARSVTKNGLNVHLSPIEFKLLTMLVAHAGKVVTHRQILNEVWGSEYSDEAQYLRVYVGYLRKKLEDDPSRPSLILTEPRIGYRLQVDSARA